MGCNIHCHIEIKTRWTGDTWLHYSSPYIRRNYRLFTMIAGVREADVSAIGPVPPRGLPEDTTFETRLDYYVCPNARLTTRENWHDEGWLTSDEILAIERAFYESDNNDVPFGYCFDNAPAPGCREGVTAARLVFWFDN